MDRDKYRRLFIDEAREGLAQIANEVVELEKGAKPTNDVFTPVHAAAARARFDAVFRHAHSLKGMAAAMGYARFALLAHHLEDLADLGRQGQTLAQGAYDLLLEGCDVLEHCVDAVALGAEDPDATDLGVRVAAFVDHSKGVSPTPASPPSASHPSASPPTSSPPTSSSPPASPLKTQPLVSAEEGAWSQGSVVLRVRIGADASLPLVRAFVVHRTLAALPGWLQTQPPPEVLRQKEVPEFTAERVLTVRFAAGTDMAAALLAAQGAQGVAEAVVVAEAEPVAADKEEKKANIDEDRTVRVRTALLDDLIDTVGEVLLARSRLRVLAARINEPELNDVVDEVERLTRELHGSVVAARMTPLSFMAERLPRIVRDLARQQQKSVDFTMTGMDIELDRAILDELQAPLIHMFRNAVDHGHEGNEARMARGRPATMKLELRAVRDRDRVMLQLHDDGKGMDPARITQKALEKGLIDKARAQTLSTSQALELVCLPGFSTADHVTETSGRGVGMDVVKATLEKLGGALQISAAPGQGTTLTLQLPLTVAIIRVLVIEVGATGDGYVIPVARVERALAVEAAAVSTASGRNFLQVGERLLPLFDLAVLLGLRPGLPAQSAGTAILVAAGANLLAFRVDRILGQEEVVAKPLGAPLSALSYVAGAAILADGRAAFLLEPQRLVDDEALRSVGPSTLARVR